MLLAIVYSIITILSVIFALRKAKPIFLTVPIIALFGFMAIKIIMVPMPLGETIRFILDLR